MTPTSIATLVVGLAVLFFGRRLFWLFVGAVGFAAGLSVGTAMLAGQPEWIILLGAVGVGIVGAWLATVVEMVAISVGGFLGGGYVVYSLLRLFDIGQDWLLRLAALLGGVVGLLLALRSFDGAMVILSSIIGATLLVGLTRLGPGATGALFLVLCAAGIVVQLLSGGPERRRR